MTFAIAAILLGILFLVLEVFLPSGGLLMIFSLFFIGAGVVLIFYTPESEGGGYRTGITTIVGLLVLLPVIGGAAFYLLHPPAVSIIDHVGEPTCVGYGYKPIFIVIRQRITASADHISIRIISVAHPGSIGHGMFVIGVIVSIIGCWTRCLT